MHGGELIDLQRLIDVLSAYGASEAAEDTPARKAYDQLTRCCSFRLGEKVLLQSGDASANTWSRGVVVAYMLHQACYVVGPGDIREPLPKNAKLWGVGAEKLAPRNAMPEGGKIVAWNQRKHRKLNPKTGKQSRGKGSPNDK